MRHHLLTLIASSVLVALTASTAWAQEVEATQDSAKALPSIVIAPHIGVTAPQLFSELGLWPVFGLELGYILPFDVGSFRRPLQLSLGAHYTAPGATGEGQDPNLGPMGQRYTWELQERMLMVEFLGLWRFSDPGASWGIHALIGPRLYLMESVLSAKSGATDFGEHRETNWQVGLNAGAGVEFGLGPGAISAALLVNFSDISQRVTGDSNTGALSLDLAYRLMF